MITHASYLGIVVDDLEAATTFYRDALGFTIDQEESIPGRYTQFKLDGETILSLQADTQTPNGQPFEPGLMVDDVDATYATWTSNGVDILAEPHDMPFGRTFLFRTPDGHVLRVYQAPQAA